MRRDIGLVALIAIVVVLAIIASNEHGSEGYAVPLLVKSDYPVCVTVTPPPLVPKARGIMPAHQSDLS